MPGRDLPVLNNQCSLYRGTDLMPEGLLVAAHTHARPSDGCALRSDANSFPGTYLADIPMSAAHIIPGSDRV